MHHLVLNADKQNSGFTLKAEFMLWNILLLTSPDMMKFEQEWQVLVTKSPQFFADMPLIIDASQLNPHYPLDIKRLCAILAATHIKPLGIQGLSAELQLLANTEGLQRISQQQKRKAAAIRKTEKNYNHIQKTRIRQTAVRSGEKIYAENSDLIILASINSGAEVVADGNIHIYGPLRGRALAGAHGNTDARIFCESYAAELVSIAGYYLADDNIHIGQTEKPNIHIYLQNEQLTIEGI